MTGLLGDLRQTVRALLRTPGFALVAVLTLALGIGANTAIFSVVNGVLLRPLPYPEAERIVRVSQVSETGGLSNFSHPNFSDLREQSRSFQALAQTSAFTQSVVGGAEPVRALVAVVSGSFFSVMDVEPILGRGFLPEEMVEGVAATALVSHDFWERQLGSTGDLTQLSLRVGDRTVPVVGVMPPDFDYPTGARLWLPREVLPVNSSRTAHSWQVVGRLAPSVPLEGARAEASAIAQRLKAQYGDDTWMTDVRLTPLPEQMVSRVKPALLILLGAAAVLFLIACANVTNLLLARAEARKRELGVRLALGARTGRVLRYFVLESLVLAVSAGALGVLLAIWGVGALMAAQPGNLPRVGEIRVDGLVLAFSLGLALAAAVILGTGVAWRALREGSQVLGGGRSHAGSRTGSRLRSGLVVSQVGLTLVLLVGAGLLGRSFLRATDVEMGFETEGVLTMTVALPSPPDGESSRLSTFHDALLPRLSALPGVRTAGGINALPLGTSGSNGLFLKLAHPEEVQNFEQFGDLMSDPNRTGYAEFRVTSAEYFSALSIPLLEGRLFQGSDGSEAPHVALVSQSLAQEEWPGESPLGKLIQFGNMDGDLRPLTVVGVVGDVRESGVESDPRPSLYAFHRQRPAVTTSFTYVLRSEVTPTALVAPARAALMDVDPQVPPTFRTLEEVFAGSLSQRRFNLLLLGVFGGTALLLSLLGIYGVMAFSVAQRTREIGVRMALGAVQASVLRMVVVQATLLTAAGVGVGLLGAVALTRLMESLLFGVGRLDPLTFALVPLVLLGAALLAAWLPARRASSVDPMVALRAE
ncbi:MAG: ABC transporter permease [Gemmatimonadota bacterium]